MRTQVAIIGGGPAGLLLARLLGLAGIETVILEKTSRAHVLARVRAGVLEWGSTDILRAAQVGKRMDREGMVHEGCTLSWDGGHFRVDFRQACGKSLMVYGQIEITKDLYAALDAAGAAVIHEAEEVSLHDLDGSALHVTYRHGGREHRVDCDFVAGCDGFHGVSRETIPEAHRRDFGITYPFSWLGILSETPPVSHENLYCGSSRGFALAAMRSPMLSRSYIQVPEGDSAEDWSDEAFWDEFKRRLPPHAAEIIVTGPSVEKSVAPLRSFVCEPIRYGRLFLCGDAAHIVPPTGAKGLNLAIADAHCLYEALARYYRDGDESGLDRYSETALGRVWKAVRFSWWMTNLLHRFPDQTAFARRMQETELDYLSRSAAAQTALAENYTGLPAALADGAPPAKD